MSRFTWCALIALLFVNAVMAQNPIALTDASIQEGQNVTLTAGNTYLLDGFVFVEDGAVLTIEPGVVVKARQTPTTGDNASALIIARGGKIMADGTAASPIIFTSELDDINNPSDLTYEDRGLWGGIIVLGKATTNRGVEGQIEGIPSGESRAAYGGEDDSDNSGVLRYISIRHGGAELGPGDEINGLTLGAVGNQTVVDHIEVYSNLDDGYEWFGGTVNTRYLISAFCGDDGFDYDEGWRGKNQFWFAIQGPDSAGRIGEHDGGTIQETAPPFAKPYIYNATYIGPGIGAFPQGDGSEAIIFRDNAGGRYTNSIITDYNGANDGKGITIEDLDGVGDDSRIRLEAGDLMITDNLWWGFGNGNELANIAPQTFVADYLALNNNQILDPMLRGISRANDGGLDPRPAAGSPAINGAVAPTETFFTSVSYQGAFDPNAPLWTNGWTALSVNGHTSTAVVEGSTWVSHVTSATGGFNTEIRFLNQGDSAEVLGLTPFAADGSTLTAGSVTVPANGALAVSASELFAGEAVSHFAVSGSEHVSVVASYQIATGLGASAEASGSAVSGTGFAIYQGQWDYVFDGLALVNLGDSPATLTAVQKSAAGVELATATIVEGLAPRAKTLAVFDGLFSSVPGSIIEVHSTQSASAVFLRGTRVGVNPGYLYVTVPVVLF